MPSGTVRWFDPKTGEGRIVHGGHEYSVSAGDIEAPARVAGAPVRFDVTRSNGSTRAVRARLRRGTRSSSHHHRFGDLNGAHHPDGKGARPLTHRHPDPQWNLGMADHPTAVARAWIQSLERKDVAAASLLYAPDVLLHDKGRILVGRDRAHQYLALSLLLGRGEPSASVRMQDDVVTIRWWTVDPARAVTTRLGIRHGQIVEQWLPRGR